jgi:hypothetical protein
MHDHYRTGDCRGCFIEWVLREFAALRIDELLEGSGPVGPADARSAEDPPPNPPPLNHTAFAGWWMVRDGIINLGEWDEEPF